MRIILAITLLLCSSLVLSDTKQDLKSTNAYSSWAGIEPDKWASVWLINRYIDTSSYFVFLPPGSDLPGDTITFGVKGSEIHRTGKDSMFRRLRLSENINKPEVHYIEKIIQDIEVNIWEDKRHPHADWFETLYRRLQARYEKSEVPVDCYLAFFDKASQFYSATDVSSEEYETALALLDHCPGLKTIEHSIPQLSQLEVLRQIAIGKKVKFVDTRETEEFDELHLPGAAELRLREVDNTVKSQFEGYDLVVPYCVKDFRGFEVAKALKRNGVNNVATLSPNGLKGWVKAGLPVAIQNKKMDEEAVMELRQCAVDPFKCIRN